MAPTSLVDAGAIGKKLPKTDSVLGPVTVKDTSVSRAPPSPSSPTSSLFNDIDPTLKSTFTSGYPMEDTPKRVMCKHCKSVIASSDTAHIAACIQKKKDKYQKKKDAKAAKVKDATKDQSEDKSGDVTMDDAGPVNAYGDQNDLDGGKATSKSARKTNPLQQAALEASLKKRKGGDQDDGKPKKRAKMGEGELPKAKAPKVKAPVDVEKQCGVPLEKGGMCARSLTCKSHAMGAKRAVAGRSMPYDILLAAYQKKNQARQQKAAIDANAPLPDDSDPNPIDSESERDAVMSALSHWNPQPLTHTLPISILAQQHRIALCQQLREAQRGATKFRNIFTVSPKFDPQSPLYDPESRDPRFDPSDARYDPWGNGGHREGWGEGDEEEYLA